MTDEPLNPDSLSERALRFCEEYCIDFCKVKAEIRAGYAPGCGPSLNDPRVSAKIEENKARHTARVNISVDWVLEGLRRVADGSPIDFFDIKTKEDGTNYIDLNLKKAPTEQLKNIKKIKMGKYGLELEMYDALAARMKLGQYFKMFNADDQTAPIGDGTPQTYNIVFHEPEA